MASSWRFSLSPDAALIGPPLVVAEERLGAGGRGEDPLLQAREEEHADPPGAQAERVADLDGPGQRPVAEPDRRVREELRELAGPGSSLRVGERREVLERAAPLAQDLRLRGLGGVEHPAPGGGAARRRATPTPLRAARAARAGPPRPRGRPGRAPRAGSRDGGPPRARGRRRSCAPRSAGPPPRAGRPTRAPRTSVRSQAMTSAAVPPVAARSSPRKPRPSGVCPNAVRRVTATGTS